MGKQAVINTNKGTITLDLWGEVAPGHVKNFVDLAEKGFYNGLIFHRIIGPKKQPPAGFMIQGGCPQGTGTGGPGYQIKAEFSDSPHEKGTLSMARSNDPDSAGSQFFICLDKQSFLDGKYTAFGQVVDGMDVVEAIGGVETNANDRPFEDVTMDTITIQDA